MCTRIEVVKTNTNAWDADRCKAMRDGGEVSVLDSFIQWLRKFAPEVPQEIAACEFDCRKTECLMGHWEQCERRRKSMAESGDQRPH